jgi:CRP/FNR family transcriptional regulator, cyclic AMP receptor protein
MDAKAFYLKTFQLANHLTESQLTELGQAFTQREARKGQSIYKHGPNKHVFILISGKVKIVESYEQGEETLKDLIMPGDLFGNVTLQHDSHQTELAEIASERAIYLSIGSDLLMQHLKHSPLFMFDYMAKIGNRFKSLENRYMFMMSKDVKARLLYCFKEWARKEGKTQDGKVIVKNSLTHHDLANLISTSRQTVTVILNEWKEAGVLHYNRKEFSISPLMLAS